MPENTRFRQVADDPSTASRYARPDDELFGWYVNPAGSLPDAVLLTSTGIRYPGDQPGPVAYVDVADVLFPPKDNPTAPLQLRLDSGTVVTVAMDGRHGRFRDEYPLGTFIRNAADLARRQSRTDQKPGS